MIGARGEAGGSGGRCECAACARIQGSFRTVWRVDHGGDFALDFRPRAKTRIDQTERLESLERCHRGVEMEALASHWLWPLQAEPGQVIHQRCFVFRAASCLVNVLEAEEKLSAGPLGCFPCDERGQGMAEMQPPGWAGCKPGHHCGRG